MKPTKFDGIKDTITVAEHSSKLTKTGGKLISFKDTNGKKYSFFDTVGVWDSEGNRTGQKESAAYREWQLLGDPVGKVLEIGYTEQEADFEGKPYTRNQVRFLKHLPNTVQMNDNGTYAPGQAIELDPPF